MELLTSLKNIMENATDFEKSKNFYYENHICQKSGNNKKVELNFKLSNDNTDKIMKFGICQDCKKVFYYYDFESTGI